LAEAQDTIRTSSMRPDQPSEKDPEDRWRTTLLQTLGSLTQGLTPDLQAGLQTILEHTRKLKSSLEITTSNLNDLLVIETAARRLLQVSGPLAHLGGAITLEEGIDLNAVVRGLAPVVQGSRSGKPGFSLELEPNLPVVKGSTTLATHTLVTLFLRAAREMPHGGTVRVRSGQLGPTEAADAGLELAPQGSVWIAIKDESPGYHHEHKEKICRDLQAGILSADPEIAFAQETMQLQGGRVFLESQVGRGTTWTLYFPVSHELAALYQIASGNEGRSKGTILLVDDEPLICGIGRRILETSGYRVLIANSGSQAVESYRRHQYDVDLVVLDVILPDRSGLEVLKSIRDLNSSAPVLISSGYTTESGIREVLAENGAGFIQKPYRITELLGKVEAAICIDKS
jgi:two-component system, cell cycle sensor histidine kinase and response regulator CckA